MSTPSKASPVASPIWCVWPSIATVRPADRPGREQPQLPDRELALVQDLDHRPTDDAGGADDATVRGRVVIRAWLRNDFITGRARREYSSGPSGDAPATRRRAAVDDPPTDPEALARVAPRDHAWVESSLVPG